MGRDGAECTAAETATMDIHRKLYHIISWYALVLILGVGQTRVRQVERSIKFGCGHRRIGSVDNGISIAHLLDGTLRMQLVRLLFDISEILCL